MITTETFVFCYIGLSLFLEGQEWHIVTFTVRAGAAWGSKALPFVQQRGGIIPPSSGSA